MILIGYIFITIESSSVAWLLLFLSGVSASAGKYDEQYWRLLATTKYVLSMTILSTGYHHRYALEM